VALPRDQLGAEGHAQGMFAEHQAVLALPLAQPLQALPEDRVVLQQLVVRGVWFHQDSTNLHHRCSPRHGRRASPSAYRITRSLMRSSTQPKLSSLIEKLSKSGAGFRKSMAYSTPSRIANSTVSMS